MEVIYKRNQTNKYTSLHIDKAVKEQLKYFCKENGISIGDAVECAVRMFIEDAKAEMDMTRPENFDSPGYRGRMS